jgi:Uma2 family endonuclease
MMVRKHITAQTFRNMAEAGVFGEDERVELVRGELIEMTPIGPEHAYATRQLINQLAGIPNTILDVQNPLLMPGDTEFYPDLLVLKPRGDNYRSLPSAKDALLVIEVADTSLGYDRKIKTPLYAQGGTPELWIVDIRHRCVWVCRDPDGQSYRETRQVKHGNLSFMGITIHVDDLFKS